MAENEITRLLFAHQDLKYKEFSEKLVPDTHYEMIGVRVPEIRKIVKNTLSYDEIYGFLNAEHFYYEEYMAHGLFIALKIRNVDETYSLLDRFLPYIDNWAICDTVAISLKKPTKDKDAFFENALRWIKSDNVYTVRFGIVCLLAHFTDKSYTDKLTEIILGVKTDEYYINMALAWLISVMLVKDYEGSVGIIERKILPKFVQNKAIDKARESFRIGKEQKEYLKLFKI